MILKGLPVGTKLINNLTIEREVTNGIQNWM